MASGYTYRILSGEITTLQQFAMACARQFGALIAMRDEPADALIPERVEPSDHYLREAAKARARLTELDRMQPADAQAACQREHSRKMASWRGRCDRRALHAVRYAAMLEQAENWQPPTLDHCKLYDFMLDQLHQSIEHDCRPLAGCDDMPTMQRWPEWLADEREQARLELDYCTRAYAKEVARTEERNRWLADLRASLTDL